MRIASVHPLRIWGRERVAVGKPIYTLIDGYNLLFQSDLVGRGRGPKWLERARHRLSQLLLRTLTTSELEGTHVVYDATRSITGQTADAESTGAPTVSFASEHPEADDLLEELIRAHPHPKTLLVVSSDNRIRRCAKARRAKTMRSDEFLDHLQSIRGDVDAPPENPSVDEKKSDAPLSSADVSYWLERFNDEQADPGGPKEE